MKLKIASLFFLTSVLIQSAKTQWHDSTRWWHGIQRELRYKPEGNDIVITNGNRKFTRALYGTNTAFRAEAGDLPEFALYMPGMGGNIKFGFSNGRGSKWLTQADTVEARYRPGSMLYTIKDSLLGAGKLHIAILAMGDAEGVLIKLQGENIPADINLIWAYGAASGKKFSRDGDMGPDPESSFYMKPEYCADNSYIISKQYFLLRYGTGVVAEWDPYVNKTFASDTVKPVKIGKELQIEGFVPPTMQLHVADAQQQNSPSGLLESRQSHTPVIVGTMAFSNSPTHFFAIKKADSTQTLAYSQAEKIFNNAEAARQKIASRIKITTPDPFINTLGGVLGIAADAIWENPTYLHGSIGWRMRLNGWRGPYAADPLGWHDRAKTHFRAYALSQVKEPPDGPVIADTALHLARSLEKMGTSVFSSGYISRNPNGDLRPHHYDMNLVFIDALIRHLRWTGDLDFAKEMWPVITRHLAWEKRNFDPDDNGLYDAYACIWASDALQYSGGAGTHSSAYNYMANKEAALIASLIGEDGSKYGKEADKILAAMNHTLWMPGKGWYAEFKDTMGNKLLHPYPAVWTLYHSIDSRTTDPFQAYQCMRYIDEHIPHIPVRAKGLEDGYETISTSRWMPYDWSLNNVATAEVMHTALANWQSGRNNEAFKLFKSELLSTMYLGGSPGNIGQISFYDAARGEAYRDFADPVAMTARSLVEGLFGIQPDALRKQLVIEPGFPAEWESASFSLPDIEYSFTRKGNVDVYEITPKLPLSLPLSLTLKANAAGIMKVTMNGQKIAWHNKENAVGKPSIILDCGKRTRYKISITWAEEKITGVAYAPQLSQHAHLNIKAARNNEILKIYDPENIFEIKNWSGENSDITIKSKETGPHTAFIQIKQNDMMWWQPVSITIMPPVQLHAGNFNNKESLAIGVYNYTGKTQNGFVLLNNKRHLEKPFTAATRFQILGFERPLELSPGTNKISFETPAFTANSFITDWKAKLANQTTESVTLDNYFNDKVTNIFKNEYLSPRPATATLQLPTQGIGDWTHPLKTANINDSGLRKLAGARNQIELPQGIPFSTPSDTVAKNILFTSQWDNYPNEATIPLAGKAMHIYLLMAGSTNPMQSRITNGAVVVRYTDGSGDTLLLKNPENWYPIEQDYLDDGYAFQTDAPRPPRVHLQTGKITSAYDNTELEYNGKMIEGGAATVLDLPLNPHKTLQELSLQTWANDVVIGLMAATLVR